MLRGSPKAGALSAFRSPDLGFRRVFPGDGGTEGMVYKASCGVGARVRRHAQSVLATFCKTIAEFVRMENDSKLVKVSRVVYEDKLLASIAINQLNQARIEEDGDKFKYIIPSMAFSVFRVEALCNIYGGQLFPHWEHYESTSFIGKIAMISEFLKIEVDFSVEPWQTLTQMKIFRNSLAHARPQTATEMDEVSGNLPAGLVLFPKERKTIFSYSSIDNAEKFNNVASWLDSAWMSQARKNGYAVDTIGAPKCETVGGEPK